MTIANTTIAVQCEWIKIILNFFCQIGKKYNIFFGVLQNFRNQFMCAMRWKRLKIATLSLSVFLIISLKCIRIFFITWWFSEIFQRKNYDLNTYKFFFISVMLITLVASVELRFLFSAPAPTSPLLHQQQPQMRPVTLWPLCSGHYSFSLCRSSFSWTCYTSFAFSSFDSCL